MKNRINTIVVLLAIGFSLSLSSICLAEDLGSAFTYQGRLFDDDYIANGSYDMEFKLFDDPNLVIATQIGVDQAKPAVELTDGNFSVELDFGDDAFTDQARWLQIKIRKSTQAPGALYEALSPLQKITPAPVAQKALKGSYAGTGMVKVDNAANTVGLNNASAQGQLMTWYGNNWVAKKPKDVYGYQSNMQPYLTINYCISLYGVWPSRNGSEPFIGEIAMFGFNYNPRNWAKCDGQLLSISQNTALFSLLGTTYGGDGRTTFGLPDLRGRVPIHQGNGPGLSTRQIGQKGGTEYIGN